MSDLKQHHAIEVIHLMINQAIYNDLCTGLAYGTPPIPITLF